MSKNIQKPFIKWAGGKTQLIPELAKNKPDKFNRYLEPFVGGGALLFYLEKSPSLINDSNEELMNCYNIIKTQPFALIDDLRKHVNAKEYYYNIRSKITLKMSSIERASRFIFLNRTCFNGLWRVNKNNEFNTPFGGYKNPKILDAPLILKASKFLNNVDLYCLDFEEFLLKYAKKEDFVYLDPPYHPVSKYSDFKRYTKEFFGEKEQIRLANIFRTLDERGCKLLLSNSYSDLPIKLYKDYEIITVMAKRRINKDSTGRGEVKEILVRNYG